MTAARQILNRMVNDLPEDMMPDVITYIAFIRNVKCNAVYKELEHASGSSMGFWDNPIDDEVWNHV